MRECKLHFRSKASKATRAIASALASQLSFGPTGIFTARIAIVQSCIERRQTCPPLTSIALPVERAFN
jgi:hypothetical protein